MKKGYIFLFVILLIPFNVYALTGSVSINCGSNTVKKSDTVTCSVTGNSDEAVTGVSAKVSINGNASVSSFTRDTSLWDDTQGSLKNDGVTFFTITSGNGYTGNFNVGTLSLKIADDAQAGNITISLNNLDFVNVDGDDIVNGITSNSVTLNVTEPSSNNGSTDTSNNVTSNNTDNSSSNNSSDNKAANFPSATLKEDSKLYLTELNVEGYQLNFNKDRLDYLLEIGDETSLNITPVLNDDTLGTYSIDGNSDLADGSVISINLKPNDDGEEVKYTITISKKNNVVTNDLTTTSSNNDNGMVRIVFFVIIGLLVIINIARIISSKKKNNV